MQEYLSNLLTVYSHYVSDCGILLEIQMLGKEAKESKLSNTCCCWFFKRPRKRSLMVLCLSAVKSWQQKQNTHLAKLTVSLSYGKKKKARCKGTSFYLNQMSPFVPKQRSHPGEFTQESTYFIRTECNSCPKAITVRA